MRFSLPQSFTPDGSNVLFVEEAAEAWASVLMHEAEKVATTTPNKTGTTPNRPITNKSTNNNSNSQQQLTIDLSGAILPGSTVEFLCETVIPHFFEVAFTTATTAFGNNASSSSSAPAPNTATFPSLSLHLRSCGLSHDAAVQLVEALFECLEVYNNTFGTFLQQNQGKNNKKTSSPTAAPRLLFPVALDLGFNKELQDETIELIVSAFSSSSLLEGETSNTAVSMTFNLGLAGCSVTNSGLMELLSMETDDVLTALNLVDCSGVDFDEDDDEKKFLPFVLDRLLTHKSLRCFTLSESAFDTNTSKSESVGGRQDKMDLIEKFQLAGKTNIFLSADDDVSGCNVVVCSEDGTIINSNLAAAKETALANSSRTFGGVTLFTPVKVSKERSSTDDSMEGDTHQALQLEKAENAALRAEIEALKAAKKKKKKTVKKTKRVAPVPVICANSLNADICVVTSCNKENAVTTSRKKPSTLLGAVAAPLSSRSRSTNGGGAVRSSSTATCGSNVSAVSGVTARSHSRSASALSSASCTAGGQGGSGCSDCVKLRRALHTHGANSMPTSTLKVQQGPLSSSKTNNHQGNALGHRPALADRPMWY